jgi:SnoaL-like domain
VDIVGDSNDCRQIGVIMTIIDDRGEITDLVYRLGVVLDEGRFDDMGRLLMEDATVRTPGGEATGREALVAQARRNHADDQQFQHVITNVLIDVAGDRATARANLTVHIALPAETPAGAPAPSLRATLGEVYSFDLARTADGWRFARIEASPRWVSGDVPPTPAP